MMKAEIFRALNASVKVGGQMILRNVNISLNQGETLGIFGTFDSGKTLLLDMIAGTVKLDDGLLFYNDKLYLNSDANPPDIKIAQISRNSSLIDGLQLWKNIFVVRNHRRKKFFLSKKIIIEELKKHFRDFNLNLDPNQLAGTLTPIEKVIVEILKAHLLNVKIILLNDFSSDFSAYECDRLYSFMRKLKNLGISFVMNSYRISNLKMLADKISFISDGSIVKTIKNDAAKNSKNVDRVLSAIFPYELNHPKISTENEGVVFQAEDMDIGLKENLSFNLKKGEIVAFIDPYRKSLNLLEKRLRICDKESKFLLNGKQIYKFGWDKKIIFMDFSEKDTIFSSLSIINNLCFTNYKKISFLGIIRGGVCNFISDEFEKWYGNDSLTNELYQDNISQAQRTAILLFRLRLSNPDVLFCLDPELESDIVNHKMIRSELNELAYGRGKSIFILTSNKDSIINFADRYIAVTENSDFEEHRIDKINYAV